MRRILLILITGLAYFVTLSQEQTLSTRIKTLVDQSEIKQENIGIYVYSVSGNKEIFVLNPDKQFVLASNTKLFTTAAALLLLTDQYEFETKFYYHGNINAKTLRGDIIVSAAGDPSFSKLAYQDPTQIFVNLAEKLKQKNIHKIEGDIILYTGIFDKAFLHTDWLEQGYSLSSSWAAPVNSLPFNDNCVDIIASATSPGQACKIEVYPQTKFVEIQNKTITTAADSKDFISVWREKDSNRITVKGKIRKNGEPQGASVAITNPDMFFGTILKETLERSGISVSGQIVIKQELLKNNNNFVHVLSIKTKIGDILKGCNKNSQNLWAECLLKLLGYKVYKSGDFDSGVMAVRKILKDELGINITLADGSGLSRNNKASAKEIVNLLIKMHKSRHSKIFFDSLASAAEPGTTLRNRMHHLKGKVSAKTGHLSGITTLSGYIKSEKGNLYAFSILINEIRGSTFNADRLQNDICEILTKE